MDHALYIHKEKDLSGFNCNIFSRIYFGNDIASLSFPSLSEFVSVLEYSKANNIPLTLVLPPHNTTLDSKIEYISNLYPGYEVVCNNFDDMSLVRKMNCIPVAGRFITNLLLMETAESIIDKLKFISESGCVSIESDMLNDIPGAMKNFSLHRYYPYTVHPDLNNYPHSFMYNYMSSRFLGSWLLSSVRFSNGIIYSRDSRLPLWWRKNYTRIIFSPNPPVKVSHSSSWNSIHKNRNYESLWGYEPDRIVSDFLMKINSALNMIFLDIGCGSGRHSVPIMNKFPDSLYIGCDSSISALEQINKSDNIKYILADILNLPVSDYSINVIIDFGLFHTIPPWLRSFYCFNIDRVLKSGGFLIIASWFGDSADPVYMVKNSIPEWGITADALILLLGDKYSISDSVLKDYKSGNDMLYLLINKK